jgi:hypothetical protein
MNAYLADFQQHSFGKLTLFVGAVCISAIDLNPNLNEILTHQMWGVHRS